MHGRVIETEPAAERVKVEIDVVLARRAPSVEAALVIEKRLDVIENDGGHAGHSPKRTKGIAARNIFLNRVGKGKPASPPRAGAMLLINSLTFCPIFLSSTERGQTGRLSCTVFHTLLRKAINDRLQRVV